MIGKLDMELLEQVADLHEIPAGAYNIRKNSEAAGRASTEHITISSKEDKPGIDIFIKPGTKNESVHLPVIITEAGITETVYNDFYIGEDADVLIVAGCGIHNGGDEKSEHDGIHRFFVGKNARVKYVEKHYGSGDGNGQRVMNPTTILNLEENSVCELEMVQIKGVDSTIRDSRATLAKGAKIIVTERLMTHGHQMARSDMEIQLDGEGSSAQIVSRSVARDDSEQVFNPRAVGNAACAAHIQCDSIIMDTARIRSIPEIAANHAEAQIIHEAAIGRINNDQLVKLMSFGMDETEAEEVIIQGFLR
ncbi:MAG: SufD family Fe-S cluster assembly protein [Ruminococcaceae bacterium]|nr:SufD family Fe-S cluster assembly protein [Oscillospiraceae bacterium]